MQTYPKIRGAMPIESGPKVLVHNVQSTTPEDFLILSRYGLGVNFHYANERSSECFATEVDPNCEKCLKNLPLKNRVYFHCLMLDGMSQVQCFLELTPTACASLEFQTQDRKHLRGVRLKVCKTKGGKKGRYIVQVASIHQDKELTIEEADPMPTLRLLWEAPGPRRNAHTIGKK